MKLLFVIGELAPGGAEYHLVRIAPRLKSLGFDVAVFTLSRKGVLAEQMEKYGVPVISSPSNDWKIFKYQWLGFAKFAFSSLYLFWHLLRTRTRIVHFFLPAAYLVGGILCVALGIRPRVMSRRSLNHYQENKPVVRTLEKWLHPGMDAILVNSKAIIEDLAGEGVPRENCVLIYNGVDVPDEMPVRHNSNEARLTICVVANLIPYKGHSDLIAAIGRCGDTVQAKIKVVLCGYDGGVMDDLKLQINKLDLTGVVEFRGSVDNVQDVLSKSDIGILPSHEEGFSNAILEYMASGLPVIATDVGGNTEAVVDAVTGFIVPPEDPQSLAEAILKLVESQELRMEMGRKGYERAKDLFSMEACVDEYASFYRKISS